MVISVGGKTNKQKTPEENQKKKKPEMVTDSDGDSQTGVTSTVIPD